MKRLLHPDLQLKVSIHINSLSLSSLCSRNGGRGPKPKPTNQIKPALNNYSHRVLLRLYPLKLLTFHSLVSLTTLFKNEFTSALYHSFWVSFSMPAWLRALDCLLSSVSSQDLGLQSHVKQWDNVVKGKPCRIPGASWPEFVHWLIMWLYISKTSASLFSFFQMRIIVIILITHLNYNIAILS